MTLGPAKWLLTKAKGVASATIVLTDLTLLKSFPSSGERCPGKRECFGTSRERVLLQHRYWAKARELEPVEIILLIWSSAKDFESVLHHIKGQSPFKFRRF